MLLSYPCQNHKPTAMYAIRRIKRSVNALCWAVDFRRRGKPYSKKFHDLKHDGSKKALEAAIAWRDKKLAETNILTYREFRQQKRSNNTSGVPGVHFLRTVTQPHGVWQAKIKPRGGKAAHKTFSVQKFGYQGAFKRAVAARAEMLRALEDRPYIKHPTAKRLASSQRESPHGNHRQPETLHRLLSAR
jgi:hypothetical protein